MSKKVYLAFNEKACNKIIVGLLNVVVALAIINYFV